jgi:hypothetical protein
MMKKSPQKLFMTDSEYFVLHCVHLFAAEGASIGNRP